MKRFLIAAALLAASVGTTFAQDAGATVDKLYATFDSTWNSLDAGKLAGLFAADAVFMPAQGPAATGPKAVEAFFQPMFKGKWSNHKLVRVSAAAAGPDVIVAAGHWSADNADGAKPVTYKGDATQVFEKIGGEWKMKLLSFNIIPDK